MRAGLVAGLLAVALALPGAAHAAGTNVGAGTAEGAVTFSPGSGIQPGPGCARTKFYLSGTSQVTIVANTIIRGFVGQLNLSGSGGSPCENASSGSGALTLNASSVGSSFLSCSGLTGSYSRVAVSVTATLGGTCTLNNLSGIPVTLVFQGEFTPDGVAAGAGTTAPIMSATFAGAYALFPG